jgi:hypothetical protein
MEEQRNVAMKIALRVLSAISGKGTPDPNDLKELQQLAPSLADKPIAQLASGVIQVLNDLQRPPSWH